MISFTDRACERVLEFLREERHPCVLRVTATSDGSGGFDYDFTLEPVESGDRDDCVLRECGFTVRIDGRSARMLEGARVDWADSGDVRGFVVSGGKAERHNTDPEVIREGVIAALKTVFDPEIPVNIHDMGLVYGVDVGESGHVSIKMTLTHPNCPAAGRLPAEAKEKAAAVDGVSGVTLDLVWDPPWTRERMSEEARLVLGL